MTNVYTVRKDVWNSVKSSDSDALQSQLQDANIKVAFDRKTEGADYINLVVLSIISNNDETAVLRLLCEAWPDIKGLEAGAIFTAFLARAFVSNNAENLVFKANKFRYIVDRYIGNVEISNPQVAQNLVRNVFVQAKGDQGLITKCLSNANLTGVITQEWKDWLSDIVKIQIANRDCEKHAGYNCKEDVVYLVGNISAVLGAASVPSAPGASVDTINSGDPDGSAGSVPTEAPAVNCYAAVAGINEGHPLSSLRNAVQKVQTSSDSDAKEAYKGVLNETKTLLKSGANIASFAETVSALALQVMTVREADSQVPANMCIKTAINEGVAVTFVSDECKLNFIPLSPDTECEVKHTLAKGVRLPDTVFATAVGASAVLAGAVYCGNAHQDADICKYLLT